MIPLETLGMSVLFILCWFFAVFVVAGVYSLLVYLLKEMGLIK